MSEVNDRLKAIETRNKRVEQDKKWETSWTRRISISLLTYATVVGYLFLIENSNPWLNALVPVGGYLLSTLILKSIRRFWDE